MQTKRVFQRLSDAESENEGEEHGTVRCQEEMGNLADQQRIPRPGDEPGGCGERRKTSTADSCHKPTLADRMGDYRERRNYALNVGISRFAGVAKSTDPWLTTLLAIRGRAFGKVVVPWLLINIFALCWTIACELEWLDVDLEFMQQAYTLLMPTLGFLLVFRLNRVAVRFWDSRQFWGIIVAAARNTAGLVLANLDHNPKERDQCLAWTCAFCVGVKLLLRKATPEGPPAVSEQLAGILDEQDAAALARSTHPGLYAAQKIRSAVHRGLRPASVGRRREWRHHDAAAMQSINEQVNTMVLMMGGCERVQGTPLPLPYVTHLRTCLFLSLLGLAPLLYPAFQLGTIPAVAVISFSFLGIDGAAADCESPFAEEVNHLNMDAFCKALIDHVEGLARAAVEEERAALLAA